ncbi:MAG: thiamine phosphate synthase [Deltaproteobacteria bacterium]|nr:thiamine phosphate synthase [Deltaproteobacteria bacterium]
MLDFRLYCVTDRKHTAGRPLVDVIHAALDGGVRAVQLREKDLEGGELSHLAAQLRTLTERYQARLLINERLDVALAVDADGVHLGHTSFPVATARRLLGPEKLIGVSTHSLAEITDAAGADFLVFGPVYFTPSKAAYGDPQGLERLREAVAHSAVPIFAIGGITTERISQVRDAGAYGVAMISALSAAADPAHAAREIMLQLSAHIVPRN